MKSYIRRIFSSFVALAVLLLILPQVQMAEIVDEGGSGSIHWTLDADGTLVISGTGDMGVIGCSRDTIKQVIIESGITSIQDDTFDATHGLINVSIPDTVRTIGESAFRGCENLTSVIIPKSVISIGDSAFRNCAKLSNVTFKCDAAVIGDNAFDSCKSLTDISLNGSRKFRD